MARQRGRKCDDPATDTAFAVSKRTVRSEAARPGGGDTHEHELLTNLDAITSQRRLRPAAASRSLPDFYAILVVVTGLALIVNTSVIGTRGGLRAAVVTTSPHRRDRLECGAPLRTRHPLARSNPGQRAPS